MSTLKMLLGLVLCVVITSAQAQQKRPDVDGGDIVAVGVCVHKTRTYNCLAVTKKEKLYIIIRNESGEVAIYEVNEDAPDEPKLVWEKGIEV